MKDVAALAEAVRFHCEQQERWANAEFLHGMNAGQRADLGVSGAQPWRGIMSPSILHIINILEDNGHYEAPFAVKDAVEMLG